MTKSLRKKLGKSEGANQDPKDVGLPLPIRHERNKSSAQWRTVMTESLRKKLGKSEGGAPQPKVALPGPVPSQPQAEVDENRRSNERVAFGKRVQWLADEERYSGDILDISESGVRLTCDRPVPLHTRIKIFIPLAVGHEARMQMYLLEAVVVRVDEGEIGILFVDLPLEVLVLIRDMVVRGE